jgi:hypothetical protein
VRIAVILTVAAVTVSVVSAAGPVRSEARIVFDSPEALRAGLGPLLGGLDVCSFGESPDGRRYLVVAVDAQELAALRQTGVELHVTWPDIRDKFRAVTGRDPDDGSFRDFGYFFNYWEMQDTLRRLAVLHPDIVRLDSGMLSFQNRPLWCIKISDNPGVDEGEPQVLFNGATHAREPMGTHTCINFAGLLCAGYGTDSTITWLVNNREILIVPVMNPDGYVYNSDSGGAGAYWRKNRRGPVPPSVGIDLNRNYGFKWGFDDNGSSPNPASETYRGPSRFSEPEVEAIHQFERQHRFRAAMDFHSYARDNLYPWCYIGTAPPEEALLQEIGDTLALNNGYPNTGQWYYALYPSNGTSVDWEFADTLDEGEPKFISYAFTCELGINDFWYGSDDPAYVDAEVALNIPNCYYLTRLSGVWLEPVSLTVNDSTGNNNGQLDPGERANLLFTIQNRALHALDTAQAVSATLVPAESVIRVLTPSAVFPDMPRRSSGGPAQFQVRCDSGAPVNDTVDLRLNVTFNDAGVTITQPVMFSVVVGSHPVAVERGEGRGARGEGLTLSVSPNPARGSVQLFTAVREPATVRIYSQSGGLVRTFALTSSPGESRPALVWDGDDLAGRQVAAGVYFARLCSAGRTASARIVLARE